MIFLEQDWREEMEQILNRFVSDRTVVLFGSRCHGTPKPYSDIDLCIMSDNPVDSITMSQLRLAFSESNLPVTVDVVDWTTVSPEFQKVISSKCEQVFPKGSE